MEDAGTWTTRRISLRALQKAICLRTWFEGLEFRVFVFTGPCPAMVPGYFPQPRWLAASDPKPSRQQLETSARLCFRSPMFRGIEVPKVGFLLGWR